MAKVNLQATKMANKNDKYQLPAIRKGLRGRRITNITLKNFKLDLYPQVKNYLQIKKKSPIN